MEEVSLEVAPILSDDCIAQFTKNLFSTLTGLPNNTSLFSLCTLLSFLTTTAHVLIAILVPNYLAAVLAPGVLLGCMSILIGVFLTDSYSIKAPAKQVRIVLSVIFGVLWSHHLKSVSSDPLFLAFSIISIVTSSSTIIWGSVKEFSGTSPYFEELGLHSTALMRFLFVLPLLIIEMAIDLSSQTKLETSVNTLKMLISLWFVTWTFGWISTPYNTFHVVLGQTSRIVLGGEFKVTMLENLISLVMVAITISITLGVCCSGNSVWLLIIIVGVTVSCFTETILTAAIHHFEQNNIVSRILLSVATEGVITIALAALSVTGILSSNQFTTVTLLAINIALWVLTIILNDSGNIRTTLGCQLSFCKSPLSSQTDSPCPKLLSRRLLFRYILRASTALCVVSLCGVYIQQQSLSLISRTQFLLTSILFYRAFKRCVSDPRSLSVQIALILALILTLTLKTSQLAWLVTEGWVKSKLIPAQVVLWMPPFGANVILAIKSCFIIPKKAVHKYQSLLQIGYLVCSLIGCFLYLLSCGFLQLRMLFGLPVYWPAFPTRTRPPSTAQSSQRIIYEKMASIIDGSLMRGYSQGMYILRIDKYILLLEIEAECFGLCELISMKGLQVQQVTSCHSKQGETIDSLVAVNWVNSVLFSCQSIVTSVKPLFSTNLQLPTENQIQLTGLVDSPQFARLFGRSVMRILIRRLSTLNLTETQSAQCDLIAGQLSDIIKLQPAMAFFPEQFCRQHNFTVKYPSTKKSSKLPPLKMKSQKVKVADDFMDLVESSGGERTFESLLSREKIVDQNSNTNSLHGQLQGSPRETGAQNLSSWTYSTQQHLTALALTLYIYSVGKGPYLNLNRIFQQISQESKSLPQVAFDGSLSMLSKCLCAAFKISLNKIIEGQSDSDIAVFRLSEEFLGISKSREFEQAIKRGVKDLNCLYEHKGSLKIKRIALSSTAIYIFQADETIARSVWNNLRFELLYACNDNDERYSIQTHPQLLRNLWVEACQEPFGYPSYESHPTVYS